MRRFSILPLLALPALAQTPTITWSRAYTGPATGAKGFFSNGYLDIHYDPYSRLTYLPTTNIGSDADQNFIYSSRLSTFDAAVGQPTFISSNGQQQNAGCVTSVENGDTWPSTYHPVGQIWMDTLRHRLWTLAGVAGGYNGVDLFYYQIASPPDGHTNWVHVTAPTHLPTYNNTSRQTTLAGAITSGATALSLTSPNVFINGSYVKIDSEIIRIMAGGARTCTGGGTGANPFTVQRGLWGTTAVSHSNLATVTTQEGLYNNADVVHDTTHDAFILLGTPVSGSQFMWVYCDTSLNPTPGTLTSVQTSVGCANPDDWTNITSSATCSDSACINANVPNGYYYPNMVWDGALGANGKIIKYGGMRGAFIITNSLWTYDPVTKVWTPRTPNLPDPLNGTYSTVNCAGPTITFDASVSSNLKCSLGSTNITGSSIINGTTGQILNIILQQSASAVLTMIWPSNLINPPYVPTGLTGGGGQSEVSFSVKFDGTNWNMINPPNIECCGEGGRVAHAFNTNDGKYYYHLAGRGTSGIPVSQPPQDWVYDPVADTWTQITHGTCSSGANAPTVACGPYGLETMTYDSANNALVAYGVNVNSSGTYVAGVVEMWVGRFASSAPALSILLTVQEALYPGDPTGGGIARTNEPFCLGIPLADSAAIAGTSLLGANDAAGQFRVLGLWPDGNIKWFEHCGILSSLSAGGTATITVTNSGAGDFGGSPLASDNSDGSQIDISTGTATFTVKKANFNVLDTAVVGSTPLLATSTSATRGLVIMGPLASGAYPANVTCGTCATVYSSANDPNSTAIIEKNGPVEAVVKAAGNFMDASGDPYGQFTARLHFYQNKSYVKIEVIQRNANWDTSAVPSPDCQPVSGACTGQTFDSANKGFQSLELRLAPSISAPITYTFANDTGTATSGTMTTAAYIYSAQNNSLNPANTTNDWVGNAICGGTAISTCAGVSTPDQGWSIVNNASSVLTGAVTQTPQGWGDCSNSSGVGIEFGVYQMAAYWPKSLECNGGDIRIGIKPFWNSIPTYIQWPAWDITDTWLEFHTSTPTSMSKEFLKFQHYLVARASPAYYNSTKVFYGHTILDPAAEINYYSMLQNTASPAVPMGQFFYQCPSGCTATGSTEILPDRGVTVAHFPLATYRWYNGPVGGGPNQEEFRFSDLMRFLQLGQTGRYLNALHFYRFIASITWPHSDGTSKTDSRVNAFRWSDRPSENAANPELEGSGYPSITRGCQSNIPAPGTCTTITNGSKSFLDIFDPLHFHWYGLPAAYFMTGDETLREAMLSRKAWFLNTDTYQGGQQLSVSQKGSCGTEAFCYARAFGIALMGSTRLGDLLAVTGDSDAPGVFASGAYIYKTWIKPDVCVPGNSTTWPTGCTLPAATQSSGAFAPDDPSGVSRVRGIHLTSNRALGWCPQDFGTSYYRFAQDFQHSILVKGLSEYRLAVGATSAKNWLPSDYEFSGDLMLGLGRSVMLEIANDDGTSNWQSANGNGLYNGGRYGVPPDIANVCSFTTGQLPTTGFVTTNGTAVTYSSGTNFAGISNGHTIGINGTPYVTATVNSNTSITLTSSAGINSTPVPYMSSITQPIAFGIYPSGASGTATVSGGTAVLGLTGAPFPTDGSWNGLVISFSSSNTSTVASVTDGTHLTLATATSNGTFGYAINPTVYQVGSSAYDMRTLAQPGEAIWDNFHGIYLDSGATDWQRQFNIRIQQLAAHTTIGSGNDDFGSADIWDDINDINTAGNALQDVAFTCTNCSGSTTSYTLQFTAPSHATALRIKWNPVAAQAIQTNLTTLLGFDNLVTQNFAVPPAFHIPWFGTNTTIEPAPTGSVQTFTVATGITGLTAPNFSVKAMAPAGAVPSGTVVNGRVTISGTAVQ